MGQINISDRVTTIIKKRTKYFSRLLILPSILLFLVGCDGATGVDTGETNPKESDPQYKVVQEDGTGTVRLYLTDFPIKNKNVKSVIISIESIDIHQIIDSEKRKNKKRHNRHYHHRCSSQTGEWVRIVDYGDKGKMYDLLQLQNGRVADLGNFKLDPGSYNMIRVNLKEDNLILLEKNGSYSLQPLKIPSWQSETIIILGKFNVEESGITNVLIDFNAQKSVYYSHFWGYYLIPIIFIKEVSTSENVVQTITAADGGEINVWGDISVNFPENALPADMDITLKPVGAPLVMPFSSARILDSVYQVSPDGQMLYEPVTITMHYSETDITDNDLDESTLALYYFDTAGNKWVKNVSTIDSDIHTVTADFTMLAQVGIGGHPLTAPTIDPTNIVPAESENASSEVPLKITATVTDPDGLEKVVLNYRGSGGLAFNFIEMELNSSNSYEATIPLSFVRNELEPTGIEVYIEAKDLSGEISYAPITASITPHLYEYDPDLDDDGMNDRWEIENGLDITVDDSTLDPDGDGTTNGEEYVNDTDPDDPQVVPVPENIVSESTLTIEEQEYSDDIWDFVILDTTTSITPSDSAVAFDINYDISFIRFYIVDNGIFIRYANKDDQYNNTISSISYSDPSTAVNIYRDYEHIDEFAFEDGSEVWQPLPLVLDITVDYTIRAWNSNNEEYSQTFSDFHSNQ